MHHSEMIGAHHLGQNGCDFRVWAPAKETVVLELQDSSARKFQLEKDPRGYHHIRVENVAPGTRYYYRLEGNLYPDPASRYQPEGVHGPSEVVDPAFEWTDQDWVNPAISEYVLYELHVGTFTRQGTFESTSEHLDRLCDLGINAIEIMPVAQFPGTRNWGYDGVFPFAVQNSYGGPAGLKNLVSVCHDKGLAVVLDVVYNHLGPEGNYFSQFAPYFTERYQTPWGKAFNFDGPHSDGVRAFFFANVRYWLEEFHIDALRLDAVHAILDRRPFHFLEQMAEQVDVFTEATGREAYLIAESDLNDPRLIQDRDHGGFGLNGVWNDDFHHALHALMTGEQQGYYQDFGDLNDLAKAFLRSFVYTGQYSQFRKRSHGRSPGAASREKFIVFSQNHDQVGNRAGGDRLTTSLSFEGLKLAATCVLLSPFTPLLFMGEEYGETAPFPYFISHSDEELIGAVRRGRREEFSQFSWEQEVPDPYDEGTFQMAVIRPQDPGARGDALAEYYRELIRLRRNLWSGQTSRQVHEATLLGRCLRLKMSGLQEVLLFLNFTREVVTIEISGEKGKLLESASQEWGGPGTLVPETITGRQEKIKLHPESAILLQETGLI